VIRIGSTTPRGYPREDFADAWARYLPSPHPLKQRNGCNNATNCLLRRRYRVDGAFLTKCACIELEGCTELPLLGNFPLLLCLGVVAFAAVSVAGVVWLRVTWFDDVTRWASYASAQ